MDLRRLIHYSTFPGISQSIFGKFNNIIGYIIDIFAGLCYNILRRWIRMVSVILRDEFYYIDCSDFSINFRSHSAGTPRVGYKPHVHNTGEIMLAGTGASVIFAGDKVVHLKAPYFIFIPPETLHEQINDYPAPYSRYCISFSQSYLDGEAARFPHEFLAFGLKNEEYDRLEAIAHLMNAFFSEIEDERFPDGDLTEEQKETLSKERLKYLMALFLCELSPMISNHTNGDVSSQRLRYITEVCGYVSDNIAAKLTIDTLSREFYISRTKLTRDFREALGMSVSEYIAAVRINRSKLSLDEGRTVAETAELCGFSSPSHFIRIFTEMTGCTPAVFRKLRR